MPSATRKKSHARGNGRGFTAAAFAGVVGLPDPGRGPTLGDGGFYAACEQFNRRFDEMTVTRWPELRGFARTERYFAATLR